MLCTNCLQPGAKLFPLDERPFCSWDCLETYGSKENRVVHRTCWCVCHTGSVVHHGPCHCERPSILGQYGEMGYTPEWTQGAK